MIKTSNYAVSHEDRHLACQEEVEGPIQVIIDQANMHGWTTIEAITAIEEVLKRLRTANHDDPDPAVAPLTVGMPTTSARFHRLIVLLKPM